MTEDEAKTNWCPFVRRMAWCVSKNMNDAKRTIGYCGLVGKP